MVATYLIKDIVKGIIAFINRNKGPSRIEFIELTKALKDNSSLLHEQKLISEKLSTDVRRIYLFLKAIAGEKWPEYRKVVGDIEKEIKESGLNQ